MYFKAKGVRHRHLNKKVEYLIDEFLVKGTINLIYAPPKMGKSSFLIGLVNYLIKNTHTHTFYFDYDNPLIMLEDRGLTAFIEDNNSRFDYIHPDVILLDSKEALSKLEEDCKEKDYSDVLVIIDSATDFCDETNDNSVKIFFRKLKIIRNSGVTVIVLHHTNKKNAEFKGSSIFSSGSDNIFALKKEKVNANSDYMLLHSDNARFGKIRSKAFLLDRTTWSLKEVSFDEANINKSDREFIEKVLKSLEENGNMGQSRLLESIGIAKDNNRARAKLHEFDGRYWQKCEISKSKYEYKKID